MVIPGGPRRMRMVGFVIRATVAVGLIGGSQAVLTGHAAGATVREAHGPRAAVHRVVLGRSRRFEAASRWVIDTWAARSVPLGSTGDATAPRPASPPSPVVTTTAVPPPVPSGLGELAAAVVAVVPGWARSAVQPRYEIGSGGCGDGCTSPGNPPTTQFSPWVMSQPFAFVEAAVAHEYAHALGFARLGAYRFADWSEAPEPWAQQFHVLDAPIRRSDDREAVAACIARVWTGGFPGRPTKSEASARCGWRAGSAPRPRPR